MFKAPVISTLLFVTLTIACSPTKRGNTVESPFYSHATETLDSLYARYGVEGQFLLRENYPDDVNYRASYLAADDSASAHKLFSYLWPFSGTLSAISAIYETSGDERYLAMFDQRAIPGLEEYYDTLRTPPAYSSYITSFPMSDRFYDDNVWIGIDMADMYALTHDPKYLEKALTVWKFIESGTDDILGGGIYWCEQHKKGKNTCSNAPGSVLALKLFNATADTTFLTAGRDLYNWTKKHLMDPDDALYFDHIALNGDIGRAKFSYNSGQMIQAASLLYKFTGDETYLNDARLTAASAIPHFFPLKAQDEDGTFNLLAGRDIWFAAVMLRGYIELYQVDGDSRYIDTYRRNLRHAWNVARDPATGLFYADWSGEKKEPKQWLLNQAAMSEMYARMAQYASTAATDSGRL